MTGTRALGKMACDLVDFRKAILNGGGKGVNWIGNAPSGCLCSEEHELNQVCGKYRDKEKTKASIRDMGNLPRILLKMASSL